MSTVIRVENLSKKYIIRHQQQGNYQTFREVMTSKAKNLGRRVLHPFTQNASLAPIKEEFWALKDVSFEVKQGDRIGIIGRNGAGKSTLLKILSRITEPTTGRIAIKGRVASLLEVGTGFHPELTGRENIFLNGAILGMSKAEIKKKFDEIVAFAEVEKFLDTPVKRYSSGMYVRLAFAVAAHLEPEILIVDEVLAVGDARFQKKCLGKMGEIGTEGRTVLFVSHNMGAINALCDRCILFNKGIISKIGSVKEAISAYLGNGEFKKVTNLINHPNRNKGIVPILTMLKINIQNDCAYYGESLEFIIEYNTEKSIINPQFCILIYNSESVKVFTLVSSYQNNDLPNFLIGKGKVRCIIGALPLLPDDYSITLKLWQPGRKLDEVENATNLRVEWIDRNCEQLNWNSSMGMIYVDANWQINVLK